MPLGSLQVSSSLRKKFGVLAEAFGAFDGIVVGEGEEIHAALVEEGVNLIGIAVTFAAKAPDNGGRAGSGEVGVNMQVAFHEDKYAGRVLPGGDNGAKVLKRLLLNSLAIVHSFLTKHSQ